MHAVTAFAPALALAATLVLGGCSGDVCAEARIMLPFASTTLERSVQRYAYLVAHDAPVEERRHAIARAEDAADTILAYPTVCFDDRRQRWEVAMLRREIRTIDKRLSAW